MPFLKLRRLPYLLVGVLGLLALAPVSCSRTSLSMPRPCSEEGATQPCYDACGAGTETCRGGYWQDCTVPVAQRSCQNTCGEGTQQCVDGRWRECNVPVVERTCDNTCGTGTQACRDDTWGPCVVASVTRSCTNECGRGLEVCEDDSWGECEVQPTTRPCADACGVGTETCIDGDWQGICEVPAVSRRCSNNCGTGEQVCSEGSWSTCKVPPVERTCATVCGTGKEVCVDNVWSECDAPKPKPPKLRATVRDFRDTHPDFEMNVGHTGADLGIVQELLGSDGKPVFDGPTPTTTTAENFNQWYRDVAGVNSSKELSIQLLRSSRDPEFYRFNGSDFFPIDDELFGNQGRIHNYHFTLEIETQFRYLGGEVFKFTGDDDLWVFINRRLAIDLGGLHPSLEGSVDLDAKASELQITPGNIYSLHLFFAERHTVESNFIIETSIADVPSCD